jgi:hypothetical protein
VFAEERSNGCGPCRGWTALESWGWANGQLNKDLYDQNVPNNLTSVVAGMVKVFVADVVETGTFS